MSQPLGLGLLARQLSKGATLLGFLFLFLFLLPPVSIFFCILHIFLVLRALSPPRVGPGPLLTTKGSGANGGCAYSPSTITPSAAHLSLRLNSSGFAKTSRMRYQQPYPRSCRIFQPQLNYPSRLPSLTTLPPNTAKKNPGNILLTAYVVSRDCKQSEKPPSYWLCCLQPWPMFGLSTPRWKALLLPTTITAKPFPNTDASVAAPSRSSRLPTPCQQWKHTKRATVNCNVASHLAATALPRTPQQQPQRPSNSSHTTQTSHTNSLCCAFVPQPQHSAALPRAHIQVGSSIQTVCIVPWYQNPSAARAAARHSALCIGTCLLIIYVITR